MQLFCLQLEASCLQWSFLLTVDNFSFFTYNWSFFAYSFSFFTYNWSFFAYTGKVRLIRTLRDCKQRSLSVSKKAPSVSKKLPPLSGEGKVVMFQLGIGTGLRRPYLRKELPQEESGVDNRVVSKRVVLADVPLERKPERGYIRMFPRNENWNEGTFACSPGTKTRTRARSPKPPFTKPPFYLPVKENRHTTMITTPYVASSLALPPVSSLLRVNAFGTPVPRKAL